MSTTHTPIGKDEKERLEHFLKRRQLKERMVKLLESVKEAHCLKAGQVTTAKDASYEDIVQSLTNSLGEGWLGTEALTKILDEAEIAGRQHICLFSVDETDAAAVSASLGSPRTLNDKPTELEEFWKIPLEPYTRILPERHGQTLSKIIAVRKYWVDIDRVSQPDYKKVEQKREKERAAMIIKYDPTSHLLQFRVPIKEQAPGVDTSKSVYEFIAELVQSQYGDAGIAWLLRLKPFKIGDAFQKIVQNRDDFQLHTDHPENKHFKSSMSKKGAPELGKDIRDYSEWVYENGFARSCIRGIWGSGDGPKIDVRMHYEQVKVSKTLTRQVARLYFAKPYSDEDVEHVIQRVRDHF